MIKVSQRFARYVLFFVISASLSYGYLFLPATYQNLDDKLRDFLFLARGVTPASNDVVIIDIDEKSLRTLGQWPWERNTIAKMIENLSAAGAGIIGLDIIFSEEDKTSPHRFAKKFHLSGTFANYDNVLSRTIGDTPTILGYVFNFDQKDVNVTSDAPNIPAIFIEKNMPDTHYLLVPHDVLSNIDVIQNNSYSSGFINNVPDASGSIRSVPLIMRYEESIYPSLSFEMFRIAIDAKKVVINYSPTGVSSIQASNLIIPTDRNGQLYLNHRGPAKTFHYLSASDIVQNKFNPKDVEGKYVLVGTSAYGLMDLRSTPFDNIFPGIEIHATAIDNLINQDMLLRPDWIEIAELGMIISLAAIIIMGFSQFSPLWLIGSFSVLSVTIGYLNYYLLFHYHIIFTIFFMFLTLGASFITVLAMSYFFENRQKQQVKKKFAQKVSPQVMEDLLANDTYNALQTREVAVTIFFSDIRSFTTISEQLGTPERLVSFLNEYMTAMAEPIVNSRGTIDKFIGDAIMAYWNAPNLVENHADMAVQSALKQLSMRESLNKKFQEQFGIILDFGIGLNTGLVTVGDIGSQGRSDYTVIGDPVNLASRLEGLCKYYHVRLIISETTYKALRSSYVIRELDIVRVKGKTEPIRIYEVIDAGTATQEVKKELLEFHSALELYRNAKFEDAAIRFQSLYEHSDNSFYSLYIERCNHLIELNLDHFDGVYEFHEK